MSTSRKQVLEQESYPGRDGFILGTGWRGRGEPDHREGQSERDLHTREKEVDVKAGQRKFSLSTGNTGTLL